MVEVRISGVSAQILGPLPAEVHQILKDTFTWVDPLDFNQTIEFYKDDQSFHAGYYRKVIQVLNKYAVEHRITVPVINKQYDWEFRFNYRPLQEDCVKVCSKNVNGIIKGMAGIGKTVIMSGIVSEFKTDTLILVQNDTPFGQAVRTIHQALDIPMSEIGKVGGDEKTIGPITVMTIQSFVSELANNPTGKVIDFVKTVKLILVDECHHGAADSYIRLFSMANSAQRIFGVSATPERDDDRNCIVEALLGPVIHEITYKQAIDNGLLCPVTVYNIKVPPKQYEPIKIGEKDNDFIVRKKKLSKYQSIYKDYIVKNTERNMIGVSFARQANSNGNSCAIIVARIEHGEELRKLMPEAVLLTSQTDRRVKEQILDDLQQKRLMTVITTLMDEAVDIPSLGAVALMAGGKSSIKLIQRLRSLRTFEGQTSKGYYIKKRGYVLYPNDSAPFLSSHSASCASILRKLVKESEKNEWI